MSQFLAGLIEIDGLLRIEPELRGGLERRGELERHRSGHRCASIDDSVDHLDVMADVLGELALGHRKRSEKLHGEDLAGRGRRTLLCALSHGFGVGLLVIVEDVDIHSVVENTEDFVAAVKLLHALDGARIATLIDGMRERGDHTVSLPALGCGAYVAVLSAEGESIGELVVVR